MLEDVLALFMQRYGLKEPDDSAGVKVIQSAMAGTATIAEVRRVLTSQYELHPFYEEQVLAILDGLTDAGVDDAVVEEAPASTEADEPPRRRGRTTK